MFYHKKCFWWCSMIFIVFLVGFVISVETIKAEQKTFSIVIGGSDSKTKTASGMYDDERGVIIINTKGGMKLGPIVSSTSEAKEEARKKLREIDSLKFLFTDPESPYIESK